MLKKFLSYVLGYSIPLCIILPFYTQFNFYTGIVFGIMTGVYCAVILFIFNWLMSKWLK